MSWHQNMGVMAPSAWLGGGETNLKKVCTKTFLSSLKNTAQPTGFAGWCVMTDWQPIETAPKDGTNILAWPCSDGWGDEYFPYVVQWVDANEYHEGMWREAAGEKYDWFNPTHWMPLPEPPK